MKSMQIRNPQTNEWEPVYLPPTGDTLPIGSIVDYDGNVVPTNYEQVEDPNEYSTNEVKTNKTWIDGKPIYRKVYQIDVSSSSESAILNLNISDFDTIYISNNSFLRSNSNASKPLNVYENSGQFIRTELGVLNNKETARISVFHSTDVYYTGTAYVIVEYTKTTDEEV